MRYLPLFLLAFAQLAPSEAAQQGRVEGDEHLDAIRKSTAKTGYDGYAYEVVGRFERGGEFLPENILTSRMKIYQSARNGERILVKGPEGLWLTPDERLGEKTEKGNDPEAPDIVRTLQGAEAPHRIVEALLAEVDKGRAPEDREVDGVMCRRYLLYHKKEALKESLERQMEKAIEKKSMARPDEVRWSSSAKGGLRIYIDRKDGRLVKAIDERSVKIAYKVPDQQPDIKTYKTEMEFVFSKWGKATLSLPKEVKERLEIKE